MDQQQVLIGMRLFLAAGVFLWQPGVCGTLAAALSPIQRCRWRAF
jgi:hypothetical protein